MIATDLDRCLETDFFRVSTVYSIAVLLKMKSSFLVSVVVHVSSA